jgi:hypothetical protein
MRKISVSRELNAHELSKGLDLPLQARAEPNCRALYL